MGFGSLLPNKGSLAVRFRLGQSSICFVNSHFKDGQGNLSRRNREFHRVCQNLSFQFSEKILSHDLVFWFGDLNYRIDKDRDEAIRCISESDWPALLEADQLRLAQQKKKDDLSAFAFSDFEEGEISFPPTYKLQITDPEGEGSEMNDDDAELRYVKGRIPSYTDRILWRLKQPDCFEESEEEEEGEREQQNEESVSVVSYDALDTRRTQEESKKTLLSSDHYPVVGEFRVTVRERDEELFEQARTRMEREFNEMMMEEKGE